MTRQQTVLRPAARGAARPDGTRRQAPAPAAPGPVPRQRRRSVLALGVVLAGTGALAGAWAFTAAVHRADVLAIARDVPAGTRITAADLTAVPVSASEITMIPARQETQAVGEFAAVPLRAGSLLVPADLTTAMVPGPGQQLVPVALKASQLPASGLAPGEQVLVIATPGAAGQPASGSAQAPLTQDVPATVYRVSAPDDSGTVVADLLVAAGQGPAVAEQDSTGQIALVITTEGRTG